MNRNETIDCLAYIAALWPNFQAQGAKVIDAWHEQSTLNRWEVADVKAVVSSLVQEGRPFGPSFAEINKAVIQRRRIAASYFQAPRIEAEAISPEEMRATIEADPILSRLMGGGSDAKE